MAAAVSIIIPVLNQWKLTEACLRSLREHTPQDAVQVLVVDNGSTDETATLCAPLGAALFGPHFRYIPLGRNRNFGPACNEGARAADADYLFFLNNDTLLTAGWLPPLLEAFALRPKLGAAGPLLLYPDDLVQHVGVTFTPLRQVTHLYQFFPRNHPALFRERNLQALTGAALMVPARLFAACGGFFEEYRNGYEDLDLCAQIRLKGLNLRCIPKSVVYHLTSQTPGRFDAEQHNVNIFCKRCMHIFQPDHHLFGTEDGYTFRLSSTLQTHLVMEKYPIDINKKDDIIKAINNEPLWAQGYKIMFDYLFEQKKWDEILILLQVESHFFPKDVIVQHMAKVATRIRHKELMSYAENTMHEIREEKRSLALRKQFQTLREWAQEHADELMLNACAQWEKEHRTG